MLTERGCDGELRNVISSIDFLRAVPVAKAIIAFPTPTVV
jgi:hypothetical protein